MIQNENLETRKRRVEKAVELEVPDRVPFVPTLGNVYCLEYGVSVRSAMCDNANLIPALDALLKEIDRSSLQETPPHCVKIWMKGFFRVTAPTAGTQ